MREGGREGEGRGGKWGANNGTTMKGDRSGDGKAIGRGNKVWEEEKMER